MIDKRGLSWAGDWLIDWDRLRAYKREGAVSYICHFKDTGVTSVLTEYEVPLYVLQFFTNGQSTEEVYDSEKEKA